MPFNWVWKRPRRVLKLSFTLLAAIVLAGGSVTAGYGILVEQRLLQTVRVKLSVRRLPSSFAGLTIGHISDLHVGPFVGSEQLRAAVDEVLRLEPDIIVITGDFAERFGVADGQMLEQELSRLKAPLGVYAVLGNHDYWTDPEGVVDALHRAGVTVLLNDSAVVERGGQRLYVVGVDDVQEGHDDLSMSIMAVPNDGCAVLLVHEPDLATKAAMHERIVLQLSGHSHGGQIRIPGLPEMLPRLAKQYPRGLYQVGGLWLYTNRGIGTTVLPIRLNARPEVTLLELDPS